MSTNNSFDRSKRRTLKLLAGGAAGSVVMGISPAAAMHSTDAASSMGEGHIDCVLISRADGACVHFLMHNKTNNEVVANRFESQLIVFGGVAFDMADAYVKPVIIPAHDRVMVRLNVNSATPSSTAVEVVDLNPDTRTLPRGTREVSLTARMLDGVGRVKKYPVLA